LQGIVLFIHIVVCVLLVVVVLLQSGKSADLAGAFGGVGSQSTFGPRGAATFLSKMTTTLAVLFMVTSLSLWIIAANKSKSGTVLRQENVQQQQTTEQKAGVDKKEQDKSKEAEGKETKQDEKKDKEGTEESKDS
jgi:preprotein translocase subunit SecG